LFLLLRLFCAVAEAAPTPGLAPDTWFSVFDGITSPVFESHWRWEMVWKARVALQRLVLRQGRDGFAAGHCYTTLHSSHFNFPTLLLLGNADVLDLTQRR